MDVTVRRCLIAGAVCALLAPASAPGSTGVNPTAAARACAGRHPIHGGLAGASAAFLGRFTGCVLQQERSQLGLGYAQTPALSHLMLGALEQWDKLPYLKQHRQRAVDRAVLAVGRADMAKTCPQPQHANWADSYGWAVSAPSPTPVRFATDLAMWFRGKIFKAVATAPGAVFGVASQSGVPFEGGDPHGASFAAIVIACH